MAEMPRGLYALPVSFGARSLLGLLWSFAGSDDFVWPSRRKLAEMLGVDPRSLRRMLRSLEEVGALEEAREWRGGYVRAGWWLIAAPVGGGEREGDGAGEGERGEGDEVEGIEAIEGDVEEDERDVVGVGGLEEDRGEVIDEEDRAVRRSGPVSPGGVGVQRTGASEEEDRAVRGGGPRRPRGRTVRSPRRNQEPPGTNQEPSVPKRDGRGELGPPRGGGEDEPDVEDELRTLARWRTSGGDPDGLGPWPEAVARNGTVLPRLAFRRGDLRARLGEGRSAVEVHRAVHGFAELVGAGVLAVENWRAPYCFAGFFDGLVIAVRQLEGKREVERRREVERGAAQQCLGDGEPSEGLTPEAMAAAYAGSDSLRSMADVAQAVTTPPTAAKRPPDHEPNGELLTIRIRVRAVADMLERDVADVLRALGRESMREVDRGDGDRIDRVFMALRDGLSVEEISAWWTSPTVGKSPTVPRGKELL